MNSNKILIIDDEPQIRKMISITLNSNGYTVVEAPTAKDGLNLVASHPPDLVLLDLGLPDDNGHNVLKHLRQWYSSPIIILSVQSDEADIIKALDNGANDYLVKPFRTGELLARIRTAFRLSSSDQNSSMVEFQDITIDYASRDVKKNGQNIKLTTTEHNLLALLTRNEGRVLTHRYLLHQVWGPTYTDESQYLRVFIAQLRKKIERDPNKPQYIITETGVGYRFKGK